MSRLLSVCSRCVGRGWVFGDAADWIGCLKQGFGQWFEAVASV